MAVFPEQMDRLDVNDTAGSLRRIESYIRYMTERMEFANRNTTRSVSEAGVSNVTIYQQMLEIVNAMSVMQSTLNAVAGEVNALGTQVGGLQTSVKATQADITTIKSNMETIQSDISDLKDRVAALESGGTEGT